MRPLHVLSVHRGSYSCWRRVGVPVGVVASVSVINALCSAFAGSYYGISVDRVGKLNAYNSLVLAAEARKAEVPAQIHNASHQAPPLTGTDFLLRCRLKVVDRGSTGARELRIRKSLLT